MRVYTRLYVCVVCTIIKKFSKTTGRCSVYCKILALGSKKERKKERKSVKMKMDEDEYSLEIVLSFSDKFLIKPESKISPNDVILNVSRFVRF